MGADAAVNVAAAAAGDVALAADPLAHVEPGDARAQLGHLAHVLMADDHGGLDVLLGPGVPVVDVHVRAADGGLVDEEVVAFFDAFGNATHTALMWNMVGEDVLITGAGPIGIIAVGICKYAGARRVVLPDLPLFMAAKPSSNWV